MSWTLLPPKSIKKTPSQLETKFIRGSTLVRTCMSSLNICNVDNTYSAKYSPNQLPNALQKFSCKRCFQPVTSSLCYIPIFYFFVLCLFLYFMSVPNFSWFKPSYNLSLEYENHLILSIDLHDFIEKYSLQKMGS